MKPCYFLVTFLNFEVRIWYFLVQYYNQLNYFFYYYNTLAHNCKINTYISPLRTQNYQIVLLSATKMPYMYQKNILIKKNIY